MKKHRLLMLMFASAAFIISCEKDAMMSGSNSQIIPDPVGTIIANVSNNYQTEQYIFLQYQFKLMEQIILQLQTAGFLV